MQLGCFGFHRQIYPQEGDSKKKWKIEFFGKFDMPTITITLLLLLCTVATATTTTATTTHFSWDRRQELEEL